MLLALASPSHPSPSSPFHSHPHILNPHHHQLAQQQQQQLQHLHAPQPSQPMPPVSPSSSTATANFSYISNHHHHHHHHHQSPSQFSRRRPKLSLQINPGPSKLTTPHPRNSRLSPQSVMSPTSRNTLANTSISYCDDISPSSSSSSSSEGEEIEIDNHDVSLKEKKRRRRYEATRPKHVSTPMTTTHHPTTACAGFLPRPQPARRAKSPGERRVEFVDTPPEVFYRYEGSEDVDNDPKEVITTMERAIELGRLKDWVTQRNRKGNSTDSSADCDDKEWVRKLVELELEDIEEEERRQNQACSESNSIN